MTNMTDRPLPTDKILLLMSQTQEKQTAELKEQTRSLQEILRLLNMLDTPSNSGLSLLKRMATLLETLSEQQGRMLPAILKAQAETAESLHQMGADMQELLAQNRRLDIRNAELDRKLMHIITSLSLGPEA